MISINPAEVICLNDDDTPWITTGPDGSSAIKYFHINPASGEVIVLSRIRAGTVLPKHYHTGQVIVYTVSGSWRYAEYDWVAHAGSIVYETAGSIHQPIILPDEDVLAVNILQGENIYYDDEGGIIKKDNWESRLKQYLDHCEQHGLVAKDITTFRRGA